MRGNKCRDHGGLGSPTTTSTTASAANIDTKTPNFLTVQRIHLLSNLIVQQHALQALIENKRQWSQTAAGRQPPLVLAEITILRRRLAVVEGKLGVLEGELRGCVELLRGLTGMRGRDEKGVVKHVAGGIGNHEMVEEKILEANTGFDGGIVVGDMDRMAEEKIVVENRAVTRRGNEGWRDNRESMTVCTNGVLSPKGSVWEGKWDWENDEGVAF